MQPMEQIELEPSEIISMVIKQQVHGLPNVDYVGNPDAESLTESSTSDSLGNNYEMNVRMSLNFLNPFISVPEKKVNSTADVYFQSAKEISDDIDELLFGEKIKSPFVFQIFFKGLLFHPKLSNTEQKNMETETMIPIKEQSPPFLYQAEIKSLSNDYKTTLKKRPIIETLPLDKQDFEEFKEEGKKKKKIISSSQNKNAKKVSKKTASQGSSHIEAFHGVFNRVPDYYLIITNGDARRFKTEEERNTFMNGIRKGFSNNLFEEKNVKVICFYANLLKVREEAHVRTLFWTNYGTILNGVIGEEKLNFLCEDKELTNEKDKLKDEKDKLNRETITQLLMSKTENIDHESFQKKLAELDNKIQDVLVKSELLKANFDVKDAKLKSILTNGKLIQNSDTFRAFCQMIDEEIITKESMEGKLMGGLDSAKIIRLARLYLKWN